MIGDLRAGVITYRNVILEHMLSETLEEKLAAEKTLATVVEANTKFRKSYEGMITSPEERALYSEWSKKWEEYKKGTQESVAAIREIGGSIARLSEIASAIAAAVEEQGAATQEIARNVQQAAVGTQLVSANVGDVQRGASETGSPRLRYCRRRRCCRAIPTASSSRSAGSWTRSALREARGRMAAM